MNTHLSNITYGVLDYAAYPIAMLLAAPTLLRHLGGAQYGVWIVCTAVVSTGAIIASGFGDANIQYVANQHRRGNIVAVRAAIRSMVGINLVLGCIITLVALIAVPVIARHVVSTNPPLYTACVWSLRFASLCILVRSLESVSISTQRAFQRYGAAVRVSLVVRIATIVFAALVARIGYGITSVMAFTFLLMMAGTALQFLHLKRLTGASLQPGFDGSSVRALFGFGFFSSLQAISGVIFGQIDRLILGVALGAGALTSYALCVQMAQPIYGIAAAGLHFLFPYLAHASARKAVELRPAIYKALAINAAFVFLATSVLLALGKQLLHSWVGGDIAQSASDVLVPTVWSFALLGLGVTAYYALLALGRVRIVAALNACAGLLMMLLMLWMLPREGVRGVALSRIVYGAVTLLMYYPLLRILFSAPPPLRTADVFPLGEEA